MANRYWVSGGTGNWNSTSNWSTTSGGVSGASVPSTADAALFNASSGSGTATLDISPTVQTLTMTGFTGTLAYGTNTISLNSTGTIFTGATTMSVTGTPLIICTNATATARTITPTAVTEANSISFRITAGTGSLTLTAGSYRTLDFTDGTNPTGYAGAVNSSSITIYGDFKASTGMTRVAGTGTYTFSATSGTQKITCANVTFDCPFTFNGVGGTFQLQDNFISGATRTATLTNGTLDLTGNSGNWTLTTGFFSSSNSNTRSIVYGTGNITLTGNAGTIWSSSTATNFTSTGTPTVNCTYSGSTGTRTITTSTAFTEANAPSFNISAGSDIVDFGTSARRVGSVNFTGFSGTLLNYYVVQYKNLTFSSNITLTDSSNSTSFLGTGTQTITSNGKTILFPLSIAAGSEAGTRVFADALTLAANKTLTMRGTVKFTAGTTNTASIFYLQGTSTNQLNIQSTVPGTQYTLSQSSGIVDALYSTIKDSKATGGATFNAFYANGNIDAGNNTNWDFGGTPSYDAEYGYKLRSFTEHGRF
jgi:hypothetical protein